jgi:formate hydrogenlyase transcriptional activator
LALVYPEDRAFVKQEITQMLVDHRAFDFTKRIVRPDGEIRRIRSVGVPVTQGGIFQGFLGTGMDVTEQERLTEELRRSEKELRDAIDTIPALVWSALPPFTRKTATSWQRPSRGCVSRVPVAT